VWASTANSVRDDGLVRLLRFAGRPCALPFRGDTSGLIFEAILNRDPTPPVRLNPSLLADLEHIINKASEKDRDVRYHHAVDLRADLKRLKRDTDSGRASMAPSPGRSLDRCRPWHMHHKSGRAELGLKCQRYG
jgi:hypothetical protein